MNPDLRLATTARSHRWPILRLDDTKSFAERALSGARTALDLGKEFAERARQEGEARWAERDDVIDRAKRLFEKARDTVSEAKERAANAANDLKKSGSHEGQK